MNRMMYKTAKVKSADHAKISTTRVQRDELPFAPVESTIMIDLSPETFAHSDAFSKMMDRAHAYAMRANFSYQ